MKRSLYVALCIACTLSLFACHRDRKGKAYCQCERNGQPDGVYEFGSLNNVDAITQCNMVQAQNPSDICTAHVEY